VISSVWLGCSVSSFNDRLEELQCRCLFIQIAGFFITVEKQYEEKLHEVKEEKYTWEGRWFP